MSTTNKHASDKFYVLIKGDSDDQVKDCVELILKVFETAIKGRGGQDKLTRQQLLKMCKLDPEYVRPICPTCGAVATQEHNISDCQQNHLIPGLVLCGICKSSDHDTSGKYVNRMWNATKTNNCFEKSARSTTWS